MGGRTGAVEGGRGCERGGCRRALVRGAFGIYGVYGIQLAIHPIERQRMQVDVQVGGRAEALDERDGTGGGVIARLAGLLKEKRGNRAMDDRQHRQEQVGMDGKETAGVF